MEYRGSKNINIEVLDAVQLGDTTSYAILFETQSNNIGYAHFIKGWNGIFKIDHSGHGTNLASYQSIETNKGRYGILVGKNPDFKIDHIEAELYYEKFSFTSHVSSEEKFVKYEQLPNDVKEPFPAKLTFYDKKGTEIELTAFLV
ncbi:hypothetical protein [Alkalibacillus haloalkaliphilus]|uniref:hypothetical protein n=1 Tax=Alkalibacillus haloalkaliphilus TaxID=94136 RepID=UPI002935DF6E|nr:hypothetical protein [Alkalibacillus haloalkaliphilus]MDV2582788.1 hypothetical protein [Alkalibacillus haloalkaliphilus]